MNDEIAEAVLESRGRAIAAARSNYHVFAPLVLQDEKGLAIDYVEIHRVMVDFVLWCWAGGYYAGVLGPVRHGKTLLLVEGLTLWTFGRNLNARVRVISGEDAEAQKRVMTVKRYIEQVPEYREVFPDVQPADRDRWTNHEIYIKRPSPGRDPTLEASAVLRPRTGSGHDLIIFDDPVTYMNTVLNPADRPKVLEAMHLWLGRVDQTQGGPTKVLCVGYRTHNSDAYAGLIGGTDPRWRWLVIRVSDDFSRMDAEVLSRDVILQRRSAPFPEPEAPAPVAKEGEGRRDRRERKKRLSREARALMGLDEHLWTTS